MKVAILGRSSSGEDVKPEVVRDRVYFGLSRYDPHIEKVTVRVKYVSELSDDGQYLCRLSVRLKQLGSFSVDSVDASRLNAISWAADRAAKRLQRILDRQRDRNQASRGPGAADDASR